MKGRILLFKIQSVSVGEKRDESKIGYPSKTAKKKERKERKRKKEIKEREINSLSIIWSDQKSIF